MRKELAAMLVVVSLPAVLVGAPAEAQPAEGTLRVGVVKYKTLEDFRATYEPLVGFLAAELGLQPVFTRVPDTRLAFELANGRHDLGVFTPFPYLKARLDFPELEVFASHVVHGEDTYRGAIVVRADGPIKRLAEMRGRRVLFVKPTSTSGFKVPHGILREHGIDLEGDLGKMGFSGGHDASLRALLADEVAAVAIDQAALAELAPGERSELHVLEEYVMPYHAYVLAPGLEPAWRERIRRAMFEAHKNPDAQAVFENPLGIERWEARSDDFYNPLRRWLGIVRVKPSIAVAIVAKPSAREALASRGDLADILLDEMVAQLRASRRFERVTAGNEGPGLQLRVDLSLSDEKYHCQVFLDDWRIASFDLPGAELQERLPEVTAGQALAALALEDRLLHNGQEWFITYGYDDGLEPDDYTFTLRGGDGEPVELPNDAVTRATPGSTFFRETEGFVPGRSVVARYRPPDPEVEVVVDHPGTSGPGTEGGREGLFAFLQQNLLEVIGLLAGAISVVVGGYLTQRRKRHYRTILGETTQLLTDYIEDKYNFDNRLYEQRDKIDHYLDKGYINESQAVILERRLAEVHDLVRRLYAEDAELPGDLKSELQHILKDGKVTEREHNRLLALLRKWEGPQPPAASSN